MARHSDKGKTFSRRAVVFGGIQVLGMSALASRLYYLQLVKSEELRTLSENNRVKLQLITPQRGKLLDCNGEPFAFNEKNYLLYLDATGISRKEVAALIQKVGYLVQLSDKRVEQALAELKANPFASPLLIKEHLSWEEVSRVELHQLELPGLYIDIGQVRYYPLAEHASHLVGYVGAVDEKELEASGNMPLLRIPDYKIGKSGLERMLEERLRGTPGIRQIEVNVHGQAVRELSTTPSKPGESVKLTIDRRLQAFGTKLLGEESAGAVVMDVENGDVLALLSMPGFDPNIFSKGIPHPYWKSLHDNVRDPLVNKATQGQYPPGSTFKMLTGLAGLMKGAIHAGTHVHCPGYFYLGDHRFNCWKEEGHGSMNVVSAITQSCDTFFYTVAQRTGIETIRDVSRQCGLGELHLPEFPAIKAGLLPDPNWKMKRYKQRWTTGDTVNAAIGQGYVLATPLQLAVMAARLATGRAVAPRLVTSEEPPAPFAPLDIPEEYLRLVQEGMDDVSNSPSGTAYGKRITDDNYLMAGKTGTSQVRKILQRGMNQNLLPWGFRHHGLFVGYAPVTKPKYAVGVIIEHGGGGASAAAPRARDLLWKMQLLAAGKNEDPPTVVPHEE